MNGRWVVDMSPYEGFSTATAGFANATVAVPDPLPKTYLGTGRYAGG